MGSRTSLLTLLGLIYLVVGAPVKEVKDEEPHRESTKEIIDLESQLKAQAGENKKFEETPQPPPGPPPKVDKATQAIEDANVEGAELAAMAQASQLQKQNALEEPAAHDDIEQPQPEYQQPEHGEVENTGHPMLSDYQPADAVDRDYMEELAREYYANVNPESPKRAMYTEDVRKLSLEEAAAEAAREEEVREEQEEEQEEEAYIGTLMNTLKTHPELINQLSQVEGLHEEEPYISPEDAADREEAIRAEFMQATQAQMAAKMAAAAAEEQEERAPPLSMMKQQPMPRPLFKEDMQGFPGDASAHVVSKKHSYETPEEFYHMVHGNAGVPEASSGEDDKAGRGPNGDEAEKDEMLAMRNYLHESEPMAKRNSPGSLIM